MAACGDGGERVWGVRFDVGGDRDGVWLGGGESFVEIGEAGVIAAELLVQLLAAFRRACDEATDLKAFELVVGC